MSASGCASRDCDSDGDGFVYAMIEDAGFVVLGAFEPRDGDGVPDVAPGRPARAALLVGNVGPAMWRRFSAERDPAADRLDDWTRERIGALAGRLGARAVFPFDTPPLPFQRWAYRTGILHRSPLGLTIHPRFGLWHAYRACLLFDAPVAAAGGGEVAAHPCESCATRPCLSACPVDAFTEAGYDTAACARHLETPDGDDCAGYGCRARHACPVGQEYACAPEQARFHMSAFRRARTGG